MANLKNSPKQSIENNLGKHFAKWKGNPRKSQNSWTKIPKMRSKKTFNLTMNLKVIMVASKKERNHLRKSRMLGKSQRDRFLLLRICRIIGLISIRINIRVFRPGMWLAWKRKGCLRSRLLRQEKSMHRLIK